MTDRQAEPEAEDTRILERIRGLARPPAEASFREQLRRDFVSGTFGQRPRALEAPPRRPARILAWAAGLSAAASVAIVLAVLNQPPRWTALPSGGSGNLVVNGLSIPVRETAELTRRIRPGSRIRLESTEELDLISSGLLAMQLSPGTEMVLPSPPGRWFARGPMGKVAGGLLRVTTGRRFHGARLAITTPDATIHVTGTTLAVIAEPTGTCVCVLEGTAHVASHAPHQGEMTRVIPGSSCEVKRGGQTPKRGEMRDTERPRLVDLRDRMQAVMN
jgi:hypothetical protein